MTQSTEQFTHYLLSLGARGEPVERDTLVSNVTQAFIVSGVEPSFGMTYVSHYYINPVSVGLSDAWQGLSDEQKDSLTDQFPVLAFAISLMVVNNVGTTEKGDADG